MNAELEQLYQGLLGRAPDTAGADYWQSQINSGMSVNDVKQSFLNSAEYQSRNAAPPTPAPAPAPTAAPTPAPAPGMTAQQIQAYVNALPRTDAAGREVSSYNVPGVGVVTRSDSGQLTWADPARANLNQTIDAAGNTGGFERKNNWVDRLVDIGPLLVLAAATAGSSLGATGLGEAIGGAGSGEIAGGGMGDLASLGAEGSSMLPIATNVGGTAGTAAGVDNLIGATAAGSLPAASLGSTIKDFGATIKDAAGNIIPGIKSTGTSGFNLGDLLNLGSTIGGVYSSDKAASVQADSARQAIAEQQRQYDLTRGDLLAQLAQTRADQAPWLESGKASLAQLATGLNPGGEFTKTFGLSDFQKDPGYEFRLAEGEKGINRAAAAKGGLYSGATLKALARFNQDYGSNEYSNAYGRFNTDQTSKFNRLASMAGVGQTAANTTANAGQNAYSTIANAGSSTSNNIADLMTGIGNARASGYMGTANTISNGVGRYNNNQQQNALLAMLMNR